MAKFNLSQKFYDLDDKVVMDGDKPLTLFSVLKLASCNDLPDEQSQSAQVSIDNKQKNFDIYLEVREAGADGEVELSAEQVTQLKNRVARTYTTMVGAQALKMLEGKDPYGNKRKPGVIAQETEKSPVAG